MPIRADNDNEQVAIGKRYGASVRSLFIPAAAIAGSCAAVLFWLEASGRGDLAAGRLAMAVLLFGMPIALLHALIRFLTTGLQPMASGLLVRRGFPYRKAVMIPWQAIACISVSKGIAGHLFDSGTLVCQMLNGRAIAVRDIEGAEAAKREADALVSQIAAGRGISPENSGLPPPAVTG